MITQTVSVVENDEDCELEVPTGDGCADCEDGVLGAGGWLCGDCRRERRYMHDPRV